MTVRSWAMPKPVKKPAKKAKRPSSDPNRRAHQMLQELEAKQATGKTWWDKDGPKTATHTASEPVDLPPDFDVAFRQRMAELGRKGGKISGAKRMANLSDRKRKEIARKAAAARWGKSKERS